MLPTNHYKRGSHESRIRINVCAAVPLCNNKRLWLLYWPSQTNTLHTEEVNRLQEAISLANQQISKAEEVLQAEKARVAEIEERFAEQRLQLAREERENTDLQSVLASVKADKKRLTEECQQVSSSFSFFFVTVPC